MKKIGGLIACGLIFFLLSDAEISDHYSANTKGDCTVCCAQSPICEGSIDYYKKQFIDNGCAPVSEEHYRDVFFLVKKLTAQFCVDEPEVFILEPNSIAAKALPVDLFDNIWVFTCPESVALIVIDKGLIGAITLQELESLIAHEMSHIVYRKKYGQKEYWAKVGYCGLSVTFSGACLGYWIYTTITATSSQEYVKAWLAYMSAWAAIGSNVLFARWRSRCEEQFADLYSIAVIRNKCLANALEKMRKRDIALRPALARSYARFERWCSWLLDHPAHKDRLQYIAGCQLLAVSDK